MKLSTYQQAILDFLVNGKGNLLINAVAGSGKTTTLMELLPYCNGNVLLTAFNVSIADTLNTKIKAKGLSDNCLATNIHKLGFKLITSNNPTKRFKVDGRKYSKLLDEYICIYPLDMEFSERSTIHCPSRQAYLDSLRQLIRLGQVSLFNQETTENEFISLIEHFSLDVPTDYGYYLEYAIELFNFCFSQGKLQATKEAIIDFNDMITIPYTEGYTSSVRYDYIFIDECQDLNRSQLEVILAYGKRNTRYFAVGDKHQAIYGFTGADSDNFSRLGQILDAKELPLSVCYRCPVQVVQQAKKIVPHIEYADNAIVGYVGYEPLENFSNVDIDPRNSVVLARKNSQLIKLFFTLLKLQIPSFVLGKDIGKGILKYLDKFKGNTVYNDLSKTLQNHLEHLEKTGKLTDDKADKVDCLLTVWGECDNYRDMVYLLESLFGDDAKANSLMLSSIHKSKGSEWQNVYIFDKHLPLFYPNQQEWQLVQEYNLKYVAITRATEKLVWLTEN